MTDHLAVREGGVGGVTGFTVKSFGRILDRLRVDREERAKFGAQVGVGPTGVIDERVALGLRQVDRFLEEAAQPLLALRFRVIGWSVVFVGHQHPLQVTRLDRAGSGWINDPMWASILPGTDDGHRSAHDSMVRSRRFTARAHVRRHDAPAEASVRRRRPPPKRNVFPSQYGIASFEPPRRGSWSLNHGSPDSAFGA